MNFNLAAKIDKRFGPALCFICTFIRRLIAPRSKKSSERPKSILFIKLTEMGATVLACEAFRRAEQMVGRENVFLLTLSENRPITELTGMVPMDNVLTVRFDSFLGFARDLRQHIHALRKRPIGAVVDLEFFMRLSAIIAWVTGARIRVGLHRFNWEAPYRGDLFTHKLQYNPHIHTSVLYDALVRAIEEEPGDCPAGKFPVERTNVRPPRFEPDSDEKDRLYTKIQKIAGDSLDGPIVLLNPNCSDVLPVRRWPTEKYIALARSILDRYDTATIFCIGLAIDRDAVKEMCNSASHSRMHTLAGDTDFRELLVLFTLADVLVSADSGPPHFAAMTDIATVVLFGPETPNLFGPIGTKSRVLTANFACSPCVTPLNQRIPPCNNNACMAALDVAVVFKAVDDVLSERFAARCALPGNTGFNDLG